MKPVRRGKSKRFLHPRWWLPVSVLISVVVHLIIGIGGQELGWFGAPLPLPRVQPDEGISVVITHKPADRTPAGEAPQPVPTPVPAVPRPVPAPPSPRLPSRQPRRVAVLPTPIPNAPEAPILTPDPLAPRTLASPTPRNTLPVPRRPLTVRTPTTGGQFPNRIPEPLPRGIRSGNPAIKNMPRAARSNDTAPIITQATSGGGNGGMAVTIPQRTAIEPDAPAARLPGAGENETPGSGGSEGGGANGGVGDRTGNTSTAAGATNGLGIDRGIPFGDRLGITGGSVYGGGGTGNGPGGGGIRSGGAPRFTLARPSSGGGPPVHVVYVVDVSGSMEEGNKIGKAQTALRRALDELRPEDTFNIITFSDRARAFSPTMRPATSGNVSQGHIHIDLMKPDGPTNMSAALDMALSMSDVTHIFLLSDGEPTEGTIDFDLLRAIVRQKNANHCRIITLALGRGEHFKGMDLLRGLADDNNGRFDYVNLAR